MLMLHYFLYCRKIFPHVLSHHQSNLASDFLLPSLTYLLVFFNLFQLVSSGIIGHSHWAVTLQVSSISCHKVALYSNCLWQKSKFLASTCLVTTLCICNCCIVWVCDCVIVISKPMCKIMQYTHMHKAVTRWVEARKVLSHWRQSEYSVCFDIC